MTRTISQDLEQVPDSGFSNAAASWGDAMSWDDYEMLMSRIVAPYEGKFDLCFFDYDHPARLQEHWPAHQRKQSTIRLSYTAWGDPDAPVVVCVGGIINIARRWDALGLGLAERFRVVCLDWGGRGMSAWMPTQGDYNVETYVEQLRQLVVHLGGAPVNLIGASLGGSVSMALCARHPELVKRLVLNDIGPFIPSGRRARRAQAVARHYVFRRPAELFRRMSSSTANDGPITEEELLRNTYFQTKWSAAEGGRVYRHDPRALQAYAGEAGENRLQWDEWALIDKPVLVIHGMLSDALLEETLVEMCAKPGVRVMHVPDTGHMPTLSDENQIYFIERFLADETPPGDFSCPKSFGGARHLFIDAAPSSSGEPQRAEEGSGR